MTLPVIFDSARTELLEITQAGAKGLLQPGIDLMPVKREMLIGLDADRASLVLDACYLLFAAILSYEGALMQIKRARRNDDAITLVQARIEAGRAEGVVCSLFYGPCAVLILEAMDRAPIAFNGLSKGSPKLKIIDRCQLAIASRGKAYQ
jgi:hypothetical protein